MNIKELGSAVQSVGVEVNTPYLYTVVPYLINTPKNVIIVWENFEQIIYSYLYHDQYHFAVQKVFEIVETFCNGGWWINTKDQQVYDRILRRFYLFREDYPEEDKKVVLKDDNVFSI